MLGRVEAADYAENDEDVRIVSELMDDIRDVVTDYQVSSDPEQFLRALSLKKTCLDGASTGHIRTESRIDRKSPKYMHVNGSDGSIG